MPEFDFQPGHVASAPEFDFQPGHVSASGDAQPPPAPPREGIRGKLDELLAQPDPFGTGETIGSAAGRAVNLASGLRMPEIPGVAKAAGWLGNKIGPAAESLVQKFTNAIGDRGASAADQTAKSAVGSFGKATGQGASDLKLLQFLKEQGVSPEMMQQIEAGLSGPNAGALRESLAQNALNRLPGHLGQIENAKGLVAQTAGDAAAARTPEAIDNHAAEMRKNAIKTLATRYLAPAAGGAAAGWMLGGEEHGGAGAATGFAMGLLHRPAMGFAMRQIVKSPAFGLPLARAALSTSEKLASMARAGAPELGRFGPILQKALGEGQQSFAASSYALAQSDPDFQHLQQQLAEAK